MSSLALPHPENLRVQIIQGRKYKLVDSDMYNICDRVKELSPNLYIYLIEPAQHFAGRVYNFAVCEMCEDGVERLVKRYEHLDGRIIKELQYLLHVPFAERFAAAEALEKKREDEQREAQLDVLTEKIGLPMWGDLERTGFITRPVSYPKRGVAGGRGSRRR
jgi:hypothetical protein